MTHVVYLFSIYDGELPSGYDDFIDSYQPIKTLETISIVIVMFPQKLN